MPQITRSAITIRIVTGFFLSLILSGCVTSTRTSFSSIKSSELEQNGFIAGHLSLYDAKMKTELGGFFGENFVAYATRTSPDKKVYSVEVTNKDNGYFGWLLEPGTYWIHYCRIKNLNQETEISDLRPYVEVKAGQVTYIGHLHYELGKTYFGKTMKKIFTSGVKDNLMSSGGLLAAAELQVANNQEDMRNYLRTVGLEQVPLKIEVTEGWKYVPE